MVEMVKKLGLFLSVGLLVMTMGTAVFAEDAAFDDEVVSGSSSTEGFSEKYEEYITIDRDNYKIGKGDWQDYSVMFLATNNSDKKVNMVVWGSLLDENGVVVADAGNGGFIGVLEPGQSGYLIIEFDNDYYATRISLDQYALMDEGDGGAYLVKDGEYSGIVTFSNPISVNFTNGTTASSDADDQEDEATLSLEQRLAELEERVAKLEELVS